MPEQLWGGRSIDLIFVSYVRSCPDSTSGASVGVLLGSKQRPVR